MVEISGCQQEVNHISPPCSPFTALENFHPRPERRIQLFVEDTIMEHLSRFSFFFFSLWFVCLLKNSSAISFLFSVTSPLHVQNDANLLLKAAKE